ncbi:hypothetical protein [Rhodanobacter thiooxydans]|uniref:hypothetical protein n=1 Tax=Rhodanobacter thiooxydans TaxID=416169 RepID=UPI000260DA3D|nr:hypothetical protein [Rhodanobacter thiooxydans]EIL99142.1 hypothetical protein UUA_09051 [Rhodanobacter thiooxydans LCS2]
MIDLQPKIAMVADWARAIRKAGGYLTDIGASVVTERVGGNGDDNVVLVGVFLSDLTPLKTTPQRRDWQFDIAIEARVPVSFKTAEAQTLAVIEDMVKCIPTKKATANDNLATLEISGTDINRQPDGVPYIVVSVTVRGTCYEFISQPA